MSYLSEYFLNDPVGRQDFWKMYHSSQIEVIEEAKDGKDYIPFIEASIKEGKHFSDYIEIYDILFWLLEDAYDGDNEQFAKAFGKLFRPNSEAYNFAVDYLLENRRAYTLAWMVAEGAILPAESVMGEIVALAEEDFEEQSNAETHNAIKKAIRILDKSGLLDKSDITDEVREYYLEK